MVWESVLRFRKTKLRTIQALTLLLILLIFGVGLTVIMVRLAFGTQINITGGKARGLDGTVLGSDSQRYKVLLGDSTMRWVRHRCCVRIPEPVPPERVGQVHGHYPAAELSGDDVTASSDRLTEMTEYRLDGEIAMVLLDLFAQSAARVDDTLLSEWLSHLEGRYNHFRLSTPSFHFY